MKKMRPAAKGFWAEKRAEAENPHAPASCLEALLEAVNHKGASLDEERMATKSTRAQQSAVWEAIARHANTPPHILVSLVEDCASAFCENPVTPFLLLEVPDFADRLTEEGQLHILREEAAPPVLVRQLAESGGPARSAEVRNAARLHIAFAGEAETLNGWENDLRDYWKNYCAKATGKEREWHLDLVETGLAPAWAAGIPPLPEPVLPSVHEHALLDGWFKGIAPHSAKERAVLRRTGPSMTDLDVLARGLRAGANADDLMAVLDAPGNERGLVHAAVLRHPAVNGKVIKKVVQANLPRFQSLVIRHPKTPPAALTPFLRSPDPLWRRLARRHKNAPKRAVEISRRAALARARYQAAYPGSDFVHFVECLHAAETENQRFIAATWADVSYWQTRLAVALVASPEAGQKPLSDYPQKRTSRDLLLQLSRDGNRLVRGAAQTRLVDPNYRFVL